VKQLLPSSIIGVGVAAAAVRAVRVRRGRCDWSGEVEVTAERPLDKALDELLRAVPRGGWPAPRVVAAVGPAHTQLRRINGLPSVQSDTVLATLVQENVRRFFLQNGVPVSTTRVERRGDGSNWAGAIEQPIVHLLAATCRAHGLRLAAVTPTAAVLGNVLHDETLSWRDGDVELLLAYRDGRLVSCRRVPVAGKDPVESETTALAPGLAGLPDNQRRFADACGAARAGVHAALAVMPDQEWQHHAAARTRRGAAVLGCVLATCFALAAPGIGAVRQERDARLRSARLAQSHGAALRAEQELSRGLGVLRELSAFQSSAVSSTLTLAALTSAVEAPTTFVSLRTDSLGGTLVALTPRAATLLEMLEDVPQIASPSIVGAVTSEARAPVSVPSPSTGTPSMERVTVHFAWRVAVPRTQPRAEEHR
jgi:hypothetical protein